MHSDIHPGRIFLKVKVKSLAIEAQIIRLEENRWKAHNRARIRHEGKDNHNPFLVDELTQHRTQPLRQAAACAQAAYAAARGKLQDPHLQARLKHPEVKRMVRKHCPWETYRALYPETELPSSSRLVPA